MFVAPARAAYRGSSARTRAVAHVGLQWARPAPTEGPARSITCTLMCHMVFCINADFLLKCDTFVVVKFAPVRAACRGSSARTRAEACAGLQWARRAPTEGPAPAVSARCMQHKRCAHSHGCSMHNIVAARIGMRNRRGDAVSACDCYMPHACKDMKRILLR